MPPLANQRIADLSVPEQLVAHSWIHGFGTAAVNGGTRGAGSLDALRVGMACKKQNPHTLVFTATPNPGCFQLDLRPSEKVVARLARCIRRCRQAEQKQQPCDV